MAAPFVVGSSAISRPLTGGTAQKFRHPFQFIQGLVLANPVPYNVVSLLHLLPASRGLYRRRPHAIHRPPLVGHRSLYRPHSLSDDLEHSVELFNYHILVYMGRYSPQHPMSEDARGE